MTTGNTKIPLGLEYNCQAYAVSRYNTEHIGSKYVFSNLYIIFFMQYLVTVSVNDYQVTELLLLL